jgi:uncharacterized protein GlcG (DUF336 family)
MHGSPEGTGLFSKNKSLAAVMILTLLVAGGVLLSCGGVGGSPNPVGPPPVPVTLAQADVDSIVQAVAQSAVAPMVIAVADRAGCILAIFVTQPNAPATGVGNFGQSEDAQELAVALARTAAFFSNDQAPLSTRTVRFISGIHFPLGVAGTPSGDLYGIENTNRGCPLNIPYLPGKALNPARSIDGFTTGLGILTGKADVLDSDPIAVNPGGVPIFKNGFAVGGVGVVSTSNAVAEYAAFAGATNAGFLPSPSQLPPPGVVIVGGIALPFVNQTTPPSGISSGANPGTYVQWPANGTLPPDGLLAGPSAGSGGLTQSDVQTIISQAVATAEITRAVIRLPQSSRTRMTIAVADLDGTILGLHRMPDGTVFSADVAVAKARNVIWFSGVGSVDLTGIPAGTAVTNRTISFGAQPLFPSGIDGTGAGPFFSLYQFDTANPCTQGSDSSNPPNQNGVVFFPGSLPLYKNGVLVGGLGVSGDGVDQDDYVTYNGAKGFLPPQAIDADNVVIDGVRMPFLKFPRNPLN